MALMVPELVSPIKVPFLYLGPFLGILQWNVDPKYDPNWIPKKLSRDPQDVLGSLIGVCDWGPHNWLGPHLGAMIGFLIVDLPWGA